MNRPYGKMIWYEKKKLENGFWGISLFDDEKYGFKPSIIGTGTSWLLIHCRTHHSGVMKIHSPTILMFFDVNESYQYSRLCLPNIQDRSATVFDWKKTHQEPTGAMHSEFNTCGIIFRLFFYVSSLCGSNMSSWWIWCLECVIVAEIHLFFSTIAKKRVISSDNSWLIGLKSLAWNPKQPRLRHTAGAATKGRVVRLGLQRWQGQAGGDRLKDRRDILPSGHELHSYWNMAHL